MPKATVNNCDIHYETQGEGPCVLFIPGETHGIEMFEHQLPYFARRFRCVSYYRRGHGKSACPPYGYSLWNQTQDLVALLDHLGIQRVAIVAVAMSTTVAATYALLRPERVRALVLSSWYELDGYPLLEERRKKHRLSFADLHLLMGRKMEAEGADGLARYLDENYEQLMPIFPTDPAVRAKVARMFASHPREHYVQSAEFYTSIPNLVREMDRVRCPILGICGTDDPSPDKPERLAHLPNFRQAWIRGARRFALLEQPDAFNREIEAFLDGLPN
ncbi:MAG: alpha/beta fold hydrolase [Alphaproteobacteria bacterium]